MFASNASNLIKEIARCEEVLPPYNTELVNEVSTEIVKLHSQNKKDGQAIAEISVLPGETCPLYKTLRIGSVVLQRNVRCLLAYHYHRLRILRTMRWEFGSILPPDIKVNLSPKEIEWFSKYSSSLMKYMRSIGDEGLNLCLCLRPPKTLYIEVKCLIDYGKFELSDGTELLLKKDSRHFLPRAECEELITRGIVEHLM